MLSGTVARRRHHLVLCRLAARKSRRVFKVMSGPKKQRFSRSGDDRVEDTNLRSSPKVRFLSISCGHGSFPGLFLCFVHRANAPCAVVCSGCDRSLNTQRTLVPGEPSCNDNDNDNDNDKKVQHLSMEAWPYRRECRGHDPAKKKNLLHC